MRAAAGTCGSHVSKRAHRRAGGDFPLPKEQAVYIDTIVYGLALYQCGYFVRELLSLFGTRRIDRYMTVLSVLTDYHFMENSL